MEISIFSKIFNFSIGVFFILPILTVSAEITTYSNKDTVDAGRKSFKNGHYEQAISIWNTTLNNYKSVKNYHGQARILQYKSDAYLAIGKHFKAIKSLKDALKISQYIKDRQLENRIIGSLGTAYILSNKVDKGKELLDKAIDEQRFQGQLHSTAILGINLGNLLAYQNKYSSAITTYQQAIKDAEFVKDEELATKGMVNISRAMIDNENLKDTVPFLRKTMSRAIDLPISHVKSYVFISIGRLYTKLLNLYDTPPAHILELASEAFQLGAYSAKHNGDKRALSFSFGYLGELREKHGKIEDAMEYTQKALSHLNGLQVPEIKYRWQWQEARLLNTQGHSNKAIDAYQRAVDNIQKVRHIIASDKIKNKGDFRDNSGKLYMELADLLLKNDKHIKDENKKIENLRHVRLTIEMLKTAELEDYFHDDCVAALKKKIKGIDHIGEHTAAIYPIIFPDRLEILLSLPEGMKRYTVDVGAEELNNEINFFRARLEKRTTHQYKKNAKKVYSWLIQPLLNDLENQNVNTLVFIPDGSLRTIPITALFDGKKFLIDQYAVATTPSLTLTHPQPLPRDNLKILVAGLSDGVQGFPPLPNVLSEINKIDSLYDASLLRNNSFTQTNFEKELGDNPYSIIHIASHAKFKSDVRNTFLLTYDSKINMDSLEKYMASTTYRTRPVELLTLSACQTAVGDDKAALGLGGIAVKAGARSALATLWYINDEASSKLIKEFYSNLKSSNVSKARALQAAQKVLIKDPRFKHPSYWAPFLLIGNWL